MNSTLDAEWGDFLSRVNSSGEYGVSPCVVPTTAGCTTIREQQSAGNLSRANGGQAPNAELPVGSVKKLRTDAAPAPSELYISTKSKIAYLTEKVDLDVFWRIPVMPYTTRANGVVKKQIYLKFFDRNELAAVQAKLGEYSHVTEDVIAHMDNPASSLGFRDKRKISIGVSKKDLLRHGCKHQEPEKAFYNCFALIIRIKVGEEFREFYAQVFNTGKVEVPGVPDTENYNIVCRHILELLLPFYPGPVSFSSTSGIILTNSNFRCGFFIDREKLVEILKYEYNLPIIYMPCTYPGVQCKFHYYAPHAGEGPEIQDAGAGAGADGSAGEMARHRGRSAPGTGVKRPGVPPDAIVSIMIFRTGSVLIMGKCDEETILATYRFITGVLAKEFPRICDSLESENAQKHVGVKKVRRHTIRGTAAAKGATTRRAVV